MSDSYDGKVMGEVVLNLADWIERRRDAVGPYADHIIHSVRAYEAEIARLRTEVERLTESLKTVQRAARTLHAAGHEITRNAVAAAMGEAAALKEIDRSEYAAAANLDSERQANAMLTEALERAEAALADERAHADALAGALEEIRESFSEVANQWGDPFEDECGTWAKYVSAAIGELHSAIVKAQHRARRQG